jgi:Transposase DDE domain
LCRSVHEDYLDRVREYHATEAYKKAYRKRSVWVEPLFAEGKQWHGMRLFRLRLLWRVNCEALMIAAGQNLKRLLKSGDGDGDLAQQKPFSPLFGCFWMVYSSFFGVLAFFLANVPRLLNAHEGMLFHFTDEFNKGIFQQADEIVRHRTILRPDSLKATRDHK